MLRRFAYVAASERIAYYHYRFKQNPPDQVRAVIFSQGRTGSTLLENLIASTGAFRSHGELLSGEVKRIDRPLPYLIGLSRWHAGHFIFHTKLSHLDHGQKQELDPGEYLRTLHGYGWKLVYLRRRNIVRHVLSNLVARARGGYHKFQDFEETIRLDLDLEGFVKAVHRRVDDRKLEQRALQDMPRVQIVYEDDLLLGVCPSNRL